MNKKISLGAVVAVMFITASISVSITYIWSQQRFTGMMKDLNIRQSMYDKLNEIDKKVRQNYVGTIDEKVLVDGVAAGYLAGTGDKYASYDDAEAYKKNEDETNGNSTGIGLVVSMAKDDSGIHVHRVMKNSPSDTAGLKPGDIITRVGEKKISDIGFDEGMKAMTGKVGEKRLLSVLRDGSTKSYEITIAKYEVTSVFYEKIDNTTAYIQLTDFNRNTETQFEAAIKDLKSSGTTSIVFDVRNNPGGLVESVCNILDSLVGAGTLMSTKDKLGKETVYKISDAKQLDMEMVVIVNDHTASAAELFACDLRDFRKVKLVGTKTYGKCTMLDRFSLSDHSEITFSVAEILPHKSPSYEGKGLLPDIEIELSDEQKANFSFLTVKDDAQILKAIEILHNAG